MSDSSFLETDSAACVISRISYSQQNTVQCSRISRLKTGYVVFGINHNFTNLTE